MLQPAIENTSTNEATNLEEEIEIDEEEEDFGQYEYSHLKEELVTYIQESEQSLNAKSVLLERNNNAASNRPDAAEIAKRDSSIKKNSSFIKKMRNLGAPQIDLLVAECHSLNLSKYLSEAASAIVEAKIKFTDIPSAVLLCTEINCTYPEFARPLQDEFIKVLAVNKDEPVANANRLRVELCFYAELSLCGIIPARLSLPVLGTTLTALSQDKTFNTLSLILSFCKHCGPDFAGLVPRRIRLLCEQFSMTLKKTTLLGASKQESVRNLLHDYYLSLCRHLCSEQVRLSAYEKQSRQILMAKGELRNDRVSTAEVMRTEIQTLLSGAVTLAELLDVELPELPDADFQDLQLGDGEDCSGGHVWEDEMTRMFYTQLPDIKEYLAQLNKQEEEKEKSTTESDSLKPEDSDSTSKKSGLETFLKLLPNCSNREMIDNAALEFLVYFNSKIGRKKLSITLFTVPRTRLELLPLYARFVAILNPVVPEVGTNLCQQLKSETLRHINKKDQVNIESKKKTVKFVGELVNFGVYAKKEVLRVLKLLLYDFTHHNIEMVCSLLETCGCVLYAASDTHLSTKYYLEQMMRLKTMMALDSRYVTLIENAYYHILPPENTVIQPPVQLTPLQLFISKMIYNDLMEPSLEMKVLNGLRCLDWDSKETAAYAVLCLTRAFNVSYSRIQALARVVSKLTDYQEEAVCCVVDGVLEDIRLGMEVNKALMNQRRVAMIKYLGELYNYRLLDTSDILRVLYSLLSFEVVVNQAQVFSVDPPTSVIRLHLILLLLNTCLFPLSNPDTLKKLKYFCTYFQHYYWMKRSSPLWSEDRPFPKDLVYRFEDVVLYISSDFTLAKSLEEASDSVANINMKLFSEVAQNNPVYFRTGMDR
uniref:MIF4G domain-containing protein n=1 Tax=Graphocephala atropunctata TaxID=36148 RepID=A0A1B6LTA5_9HEMI